MKKRHERVAYGGMDVHYKSSHVTLRDSGGAVRTGGRWRARFDRATDGGKKNRGRGYVQVARDLVTLVYIIWSRNVTYMESPPARPAAVPSRGKRKHSRPGTGQPCVATVKA